MYLYVRTFIEGKSGVLLGKGHSNLCSFFSQFHHISASFYPQRRYCSDLILIRFDDLNIVKSAIGFKTIQ